MKSLRASRQIVKALITLLVLLTPALSAYARTGSTETVQFHSNLIHALLPYNVILPPDYRTAKTTRYPVLYLLHGLAGHYTDWVTHTNVADYAARYRMIVVMPEGNNGWYVDSAPTRSASNAERPGDKYESYIVRELIPDIDQRYRTIQSRYGRAIAGLSMGGYGAIKYGLKYPGTFVFAGSLSGALAAATWTDADLKNYKAIYDSLPPVFGPSDSETRQRNDVFQLTRSLSAARIATLPYLYLDCGTEDFMIDTNQRFAALLREQKIPHEYRELPGNHSWQYWDQQVKEVLQIASEKLRAGRMNVPRKGTRDAKGNLIKK